MPFNTWIFTDNLSIVGVGVGEGVGVSVVDPETSGGLVDLFLPNRKIPPARATIITAAIIKIDSLLFFAAVG